MFFFFVLCSVLFPFFPFFFFFLPFFVFITSSNVKDNTRLPVSVFTLVFVIVTRLPLSWVVSKVTTCREQNVKTHKVQYSFLRSPFCYLYRLSLVYVKNSSTYIEWLNPCTGVENFCVVVLCQVSIYVTQVNKWNFFTNLLSFRESNSVLKKEVKYISTGRPKRGVRRVTVSHQGRDWKVQS